MSNHPGEQGSPSSDNSSATRRPASAEPSMFSRIAALVAVIIAGLCGGLIGYAVMDLQCDEGCPVAAGSVGVASAALAAVGVAIVAVLTLRALSEWQAIETARQADQT